MKAAEKTGRNDPCPCGSGKKFKHCHGVAGSKAEMAPGNGNEDTPQLFSAAGDLHRTGRLDDADAAYHRILAREPRHAGATHLLGVIAHQRGRHELAVTQISQAIALAGKKEPNRAHMHNNLAEALSALRRVDEAIPHYRKAIELDPRYLDALNNLGVALTRVGRWTEAEAPLQKAIALDPAALNPHTNLGNLYQLQERFDDAIAEYGKALAIAPRDAETWSNLGNTYKLQDRLDDAVASYEQSLKLNPGNAMAANNLGAVLALMGRVQEALKWYEVALTLAPGAAEVLSNRSLAHHLSGELAKGWQDYGTRFERMNEAPQRRPFAHPAWDGLPLAGKSLLVWGEQGVGDEIWMAGAYADLLEKRWQVGRLIIECAPKLAPLFRRSFAGAEIIARSDPPTIPPDIAVQTAAGSIARFLRPSIESFPACDRYLVADAQRVAHWKQRLPALGPGLKVGVSWRSTNIRGDRRLSCQRLVQWASVFGVSGITPVCVQYDECEAELREAEQAFGIAIARFPDVDMFNDMDEAAALMRALDLVITAPTAVGALSAALGVPTWQLNYGVDWQHHGQVRNPWYPAMKSFVRQWNESWETVLARVAVELAVAAAEGAHVA